MAERGLVMSEAIRRLSARQREAFTRLYLDGPTPFATLTPENQTLIRRLAAKGLALIVNLPRRGEIAYVQFPLQPGDIGQLDSLQKVAYVELVRAGKNRLIVRRTRGLAGKPFGAPFEVEPYRFIYVVSRGVRRVRKPPKVAALSRSARA